VVIEAAYMKISKTKAFFDPVLLSLNQYLKTLGELESKHKKPSTLLNQKYAGEINFTNHHETIKRRTNNELESLSP
jgi:hypothetical protein